MLIFVVKNNKAMAEKSYIISIRKERLKNLLSDNKMNFSVLSKEMGISQPALSQLIGKDSLSPHTIARISKVLRMDYTSLENYLQYGNVAGEYSPLDSEKDTSISLTYDFYIEGVRTLVRLDKLISFSMKDFILEAELINEKRHLYKGKDFSVYIQIDSDCYFSDDIEEYIEMQKTMYDSIAELKKIDDEIVWSKRCISSDLIENTKDYSTQFLTYSNLNEKREKVLDSLVELFRRKYDESKISSFSAALKNPVL